MKSLHPSCLYCRKRFVPTLRSSKRTQKCCSPSCGSRYRYQLTFNVRFWRRVKKTKRCWLWTGAKYNSGYGFMRISPYISTRSHRVAWQISHGKIPNKMLVLHKCDVPSCVRPSHLFLGSDADNHRDAMLKLRHSHGESHGMVRLTEQDVLKIRKLYSGVRGDMERLAKQFNVSSVNIHCIIRKKSWKHLP